MNCLIVGILVEPKEQYLHSRVVPACARQNSNNPNVIFIRTGAMSASLACSPHQAQVLLNIC